MRKIIREQFWMTSFLRVLVVVLTVSLVTISIVWAGEQEKKLQELRDGLLQNLQEMVAHGGMGDGKAILHHCGEAGRYADLLIKELPASHPGREDGVTSLNDVIKYCKRVAEIGIHADPGVLLNPATKARAAASAAVKTLRLNK